MMQSLGRRYVRYFNFEYRRSGTLWEGRYRSCLIQEERYLLEVYRYIELNPVRAEMVTDPGEYRWSSYQINGLGKVSSLCTPHFKYLSLGLEPLERRKNYRALFTHHVDDVLLEEIRSNTNKGMAVGNDRFKEEIEALTGRRVRAKNRPYFRCNGLLDRKNSTRDHRYVYKLQRCTSWPKLRNIIFV